ncbi:MAG: hypothetical protein RR366_09475 [Clostridium sp.]
MENLKEALEYVVDLSNEAEKTEVVEICGRTYANKTLRRYDIEDKADPVTACTLSSLVDYVKNCRHEFPSGKMLVHIVSPEKVCLMSSLDGDRRREILFKSVAETSGFRYDEWYDQERFMIALQANFKMNDDLEAVMKLSGNIEKKNNQTFSDDGRTQVATMTVGVASRADAIVPNPVELVPYRTFQEVEQPSSKFVFRIGDKEVPAFKIVEAEGGIWRNKAIESIKKYLQTELKNSEIPCDNIITIIG